MNHKNRIDMNFQQSKNHLLTIFSQNDFIADMNAKRKHTKQILLETCSNGTKISVSFPGYKAYSSNRRTIYDYRVDITKNRITTALSHTNIIADIYNKIIKGGMSSEGLRETLIEISQEGNINLDNIKGRLLYTSVSPTNEYRKRIKEAHKSKFYNEIGNSFDFTVEELLKLIKWIVLQEDINYPIPRYEGRKMPFARYLEAIFITENNSHTLEEVIYRTLSHSRPSQWKEMDYSFRNNIQ